MNQPLVSISCITFNHEEYIHDCLNGFIMQKTSFAFEVLIHDDASTDNTANIIKEYEKLYPDIIKPIYQEENQYNKGLRAINATFNYSRVKGKYIALCEGDDYWLDPLKLQKQVDYLEKNEDCSMVFHLANCIDSENNITHIHGPKYKTSIESVKFDIKDAIKSSSTLVPTNAMFFHSKYIRDMPSWCYKAPIGDIPLLLVLAYKGDLGFINNVMSVYRMETPSSWSRQMQNKSNRSLRKTHFERMNEMWEDFDEWTNFQYTKLLKNKSRKFYYLKKEIRIMFPLLHTLFRKLKLTWQDLKGKFNV